MNKVHVVLIVLAAILFSIFFGVLLETSLYAYFTFTLMGVVFYILSKHFGKEIYFFVILPILFIAVDLTGLFLIMDISNRDGLNPLKLHPLTLSWLVIYALELYEMYRKKQLVFDSVVISAMAVFFIFFSVTFYGRGFRGITILIENYIGPMTFFHVIYATKKFNLKTINKVVGVLVFISVGIGALGIIEYLMKYNFFDQFYLDPSWAVSNVSEGYRIKTIIGLPLTNASYFLFVMIIVQMYIKNVKVKFILLPFFSVVVMLTGTRSIFLISLIVIFYNPNLLKGKWMDKKNLLLPVIAAALIMLAIFTTSLGNTFLTRMDVGGGSAQVRFVVYEYFLNHLTTFNVHGLGSSNETIKLVNENNEPIIFENPWIILFFEFSYIFLIYPVFLVAAIRKVDYKSLVLIFILALTSFNSFGVKTNLNYILFFLMALCYIKKQTKEVEEIESADHQS